MSWLDPFSVQLKKDGVLLPARPVVNVGAGINVSDDPTGQVTNLSGSGIATAQKVADINALRALSPGNVANGASFLVGTDPTPWVNDDSSGAGFERDGATIERLDAVSLGANKRFYRASSAPVLPTIAALRLAVSGVHQSIHLQAYAQLGDGGGDIFDYDSSDTTTADDGGMCIVAGARRYKRRRTGLIDVTKFGIKGDAAADGSTGTVNTTQLNVALASPYSLRFPPGNYKFGTVTIPAHKCIEIQAGAALLTTGTIKIPNSYVRIFGHRGSQTAGTDYSSTAAANIRYVGSGGADAAHLANVVEVNNVDLGSPTDSVILEGLTIDAGTAPFVKGLHVGADRNGTGFCKFRNITVHGGYIQIHEYGSVSGCVWENVTPYGKVKSGTFTVNTGTDQAASTAHGLLDGDIVHVSYVGTSGSLPGGLTRQSYYIKKIDADHFLFSLSASLTPVIDITSTGSGTFTWVRQSGKDTAYSALVTGASDNAGPEETNFIGKSRCGEYNAGGLMFTALGAVDCQFDGWSVGANYSSILASGQFCGPHEGETGGQNYLHDCHFEAQKGAEGLKIGDEAFAATVTAASNTSPIILDLTVSAGVLKPYDHITVVGVTGNTGPNPGGTATTWEAQPLTPTVNGKQQVALMRKTSDGTISVGNGAYAGGGTVSQAGRHVTMLVVTGGSSSGSLLPDQGGVATGADGSPIRLMAFDGLVIFGMTMIANNNVAQIRNDNTGLIKQGGKLFATANIPSGGWLVPTLSDRRGFSISLPEENLKASQGLYYTPYIGGVLGIESINGVGKHMLDQTIHLDTFDVGDPNATTTTTAGSSAAGQKILQVTSTTGFIEGARIDIDPGGGTDELPWISHVIDSTHLMMRDNLAFTHGAGQTVRYVAPSFRLNNGSFNITMIDGGASPVFKIDSRADVALANFFTQVKYAATSGSPDHGTGYLARGMFWDGTGTPQSRNRDVLLACELVTSNPFVTRGYLNYNGVRQFEFDDGGGFKFKTTKLGFYNTAPVTQPTVTGSRGGNAALASLLTALANEGLIVDGSSA